MTTPAAPRGRALADVAAEGRTADERLADPDILERLYAKQRRSKGRAQQATWLLCLDAIAEIKRLRANARLIAAAPALLDFAHSMVVALDLAAELFPADAIHFEQFAEDARRVIALADAPDGKGEG